MATQPYTTLHKKGDVMQKAAINANIDSLLVMRAGPGSGQSRALLGRVFYLLSQNVPPVKIVVLMFGNEVSERFRRGLMLMSGIVLPLVYTIHAYAAFLYKCLLRTYNGQFDIVDSLSFAEKIPLTADSDVPHRPELINLDGRNIAEDIVRQESDIWLKIRSSGTFRAHCIRVAD